jgi:predicted permease
VTTLVQDLRGSFRSIVRTPGFAAAAIATLALGLGLNSAALSFAYALFLKPLPIEDAAQLVNIDQTVVGRPLTSGFPLSYPDYLHFRDHTRTLSELAAHYSTSPMQVTTPDGSLGVSGAVVTANYFSLLRLQPALGRFFTAEEDRVPGRNPVAVISRDLWRHSLGGDSNIIGTDLRINGTAFTIIGIAPEGFRGIVQGVTPNDVWIPSAMFKVGYRYCDGLARGCSVIGVIGRLPRSVTMQDAQTELTLLARQLETAYPDTNKGRGVLVHPARGIRIGDRARTASIVALLAAASALVLIVASANVAGLLLARGLRRRREIAIRMALGASRAQLVRQLVVESTVLAGFGGFAGLIVALWATEMLRTYFGVSYGGDPLNIDLSLISVRIVALGSIVAIVTGVLTGIAPALQATGRDTLPALKGETAGSTARRSRLREGLIVLQLAVSVLLLVSSGLLIRSFFMLHRPGFNPDAIVSMRLRPSLIGYPNDRAWTFQREVLRRLEAIPGVIAASPGKVPPLPQWGRPARVMRVVGGGATESAAPARDAASAFRASTTYVGSRYFKALGATVIDGREFEERDTATSPRVTIVNETLARKLWPKGNAVGSTLMIAERPHEVIGVVNDVQILSLLEEPERIAYLNFWQQDRTDNWSSDSQTIVRVAGHAMAMLPQIRQVIAGVDPEVPGNAPRPLTANIDYEFSSVRGARTLLATFGVLTLIVSAIGLYAALAFAVTQRTREIAIRMSLGAARAEIARLVLHRGAAIVLIGIGIGLAAAIFTGPILAHLLYGVTPHDPMALVIGPLLLVVVALVAIWLPTRRAMSIDPMIALRLDA